jgi:hypothetical protein
MALFGKSRDISMFRHINRELLGDIITQQCALYKFVLDKTIVNMYGEASGGKYYDGPVLLNSLITIGDKTDGTSELGVDFNWSIKVAFLRDDLVEANVVPQIGDIILYQESYFEVDNSYDTQYFVGKDPDYPYNANPLNPGLEQFGYNVSVVCETHYIPADRVNLLSQRL